MPYTVLIADTDLSALTATADVISAAGYLVRTASTFEEAKKRLVLASPDLLIADVRLGPYNGLHLVLRGRAEHPELAAIVTHAVPDSVLESEAAAQGAVYLTKPIAPQALLAVVVNLLAGRDPQESATAPRRWPRKRVDPAVVAMFGTTKARIVDLSYGGLQLELSEMAALVPTPGVVSLPDIALTFVARRVWSRCAGPAGPCWCGLELADVDQPTAESWRGFVDSVQ